MAYIHVSGTYGTQFHIPKTIDFSGREGIHDFTRLLFDKTKKFIDSGGEIKIPLYIILGLLMYPTGFPNVGKAVLVIDQTEGNVRDFAKDPDLYEHKMMHVAAECAAYYFAKVEELIHIPPEDEKAWEMLDYLDHPKRWITLDITVQSQPLGNEMYRLSSVITEGTTCRFVEEPTGTYLINPNIPEDIPGASKPS